VSLIQQYNREIFKWFSSVFIINGFIHLNESVRLIAQKCLEAIKTCPQMINDKVCKYTQIILYQNTFTSAELKSKVQNNPITDQGRSSIIHGLLSSQSLIYLYKNLNLEITIYRSQVYNGGEADNEGDITNLNVTQESPFLKLANLLNSNTRILPQKREVNQFVKTKEVKSIVKKFLYG